MLIPKKQGSQKSKLPDWVDEKKLRKTFKKKDPLSEKTKNLISKHAKAPIKQIVFSYTCVKCMKSYGADFLRKQIIEAARRGDSYISCPKCGVSLVADRITKVPTKQSSKVNRNANLTAIYSNQGITPEYAPNTWVDRALLEKIAHELGKYCQKFGFFNPQLKFQRGIRGRISVNAPENVKAAEYTIEAVDDYDLRFRVVAAAGITPAGKVVLPKFFMTLDGREIPFTKEAVASFLSGKVFGPTDPKPVVPEIHYKDRDPVRFREIVASKKKAITFEKQVVAINNTWGVVQERHFPVIRIEIPQGTLGRLLRINPTSSNVIFDASSILAANPDLGQKAKDKYIQNKKDFWGERFEEEFDEEASKEADDYFNWVDEGLTDLQTQSEIRITSVPNKDLEVQKQASKKKAAGTPTPGQNVEYQGKKYVVDSITGDASILTDEAGVQTAPVPNADLNIQVEEGAVPPVPTLADRINKLVKRSLRDEKTLVPFTDPDPDYSVAKQTDVDADFSVPYEESDQGILSEEDRAVQKMFRGGSAIKPVKTANEVLENLVSKYQKSFPDVPEEDIRKGIKAVLGDNPDKRPEDLDAEIDFELKEIYYDFFSEHPRLSSMEKKTSPAEGISPFIYDTLEKALKEGATFEEAKKVVGEKHSGFDLREEDYNEAKGNLYDQYPRLGSQEKESSIKKTAVEGLKWSELGIDWTTIEEGYVVDSEGGEKIGDVVEVDSNSVLIETKTIEEFYRVEEFIFGEFPLHLHDRVGNYVPVKENYEEQKEIYGKKSSIKKTAEPTGYHETDDTGKVIELSRLRTLVQDYARAGQLPLDFDLTKVMSEVSRMTRKELEDILDKKQKGQHYPVVHAKKEGLEKKAQEAPQFKIGEVIQIVYEDEPEEFFDARIVNIEGYDKESGEYLYGVEWQEEGGIDNYQIFHEGELIKKTTPKISSKSTNQIVREIRKAEITEKDVEKDIKDEEEGEKHYKEQAKEVEDEKAKKFFEGAAEDEAEHAEELEEIVLPAVKNVENFVKIHNSRKRKAQEEGPVKLKRLIKHLPERETDYNRNVGLEVWEVEWTDGTTSITELYESQKRTVSSKKIAQEEVEEEEKPKTTLKELKTKPHGKPSAEEVAEAPAATPELQTVFNEVKQHQQRLTEIKAIISAARQKTEEEIRKIQEEQGSVAEAADLQEGIEKLASLIEQSESQIADLGEFFVWLDTESKTKKFKPTDKWRVEKLLEKFGKDATDYLTKAERGAASLNDEIQQRLLTVFPKLPKDKESSMKKKADVYNSIKELGTGLWNYVKEISGILAEGEQLELALE